MEKKMMMPASYSVMNEEEMTYTCGGSDNIFVDAFSVVASVSGLALGILTYTEGLIAGRKFVASHKGENIGAMISDAMDEYSAYLGSSISNAVRGVYAGVCYVGLFPITAIALATAAI